MPKRVLITGIIFCVAGILGIWNTVSNFLNSHSYFELSFVFLPIGIGLLKGNHRSRWWASAWMFLGILVCIVVMMIVIFGSGHTTVSWLGYTAEVSIAKSTTLISVIAVGIIFFLGQRLLYSRNACVFFSRINPPLEPTLH